MLRKLLVLAMVSSGCPAPVVGGSGGGSGAGGGDATGGGSGGAGGGMDTYAVSPKSNVRFKRSLRLTADFSNALGLPPDQLCKELGLYPCTTFVHPVALGGTDPYGVGLYEPLPFTGMATPIVTDRVALAGCQLRASADLAAGSSAVIWQGVVPDGAGKLDIESPAVATALQTLYRRTVLRDPTPTEVGHLKQLYKDIEASGKPTPGQAWMTLSCFAVLTTVEALFY